LPPDAPPLFIDRDTWSRRLGAALDSAAVRYVAHRQRFRGESPDVDWIAAASREGWIAISRDQNIRRKPNELAAIRASRAVIFVLTSGNLGAEATAQILLKALPRIYRSAKGAKRPALFSIHKDGTIGRLKL
jgi:predicted nuclease of predicted toxin-antitoxin system